MLVYAISTFFRDVDILGTDSEKGLLKEPEIKGIHDNKLIPLQKSLFPMVIAVLITTFFFSCIVLLKYIEIDIIGIYAIYIAGTSVLIGVYGYVHYLLFLWFVYQVGNCQFDISNYNFYVPAKSEWVLQIAKTAQRLRSFFLVIGLIYVIEYGMLVPTEKITIENGNISLNTPNNIAFVVSWIALFLLVVIAFPIINHFQYALVVRIVDRLKAQSVEELSELMSDTHRENYNQSERFPVIVSYNVIIENIRQSKKYPINQHLVYESIIAIITVIVHTINLANKILEIPQIQTFLFQS